MNIQIKTDNNHFEGRWTSIISWPQPAEIKGCPLGRGKTEESAEKDLIARIEMESHVNVEIERPVEDSHTFKVGFHRGNSRVWLQGNKLVEASFNVGAPYFVNYNDDTSIILALAGEGDKGVRKVSKKPSKFGPIPVIDLNSKVISRFFEDDTKCQVVFGQGWIEIHRV